MRPLAAEVFVASIGSEHASRSPWRDSWRADLSSAVARLRALFDDGSDSSLARRLAGTAFMIRVIGAMLAFASQVALARWLGGFEFGIYIYAWTWLMLIGAVVDLGLGSAALRFIPEYTEQRRVGLLRGYLGGSRWLALIFGAAIAAVAVGIIPILPEVAPGTILPLCLACAAVPAFGIAEVQSGIARAYNWINLALMPPYVFRQVILLALLGIANVCGAPADAAAMMLLTVIALWICTGGQLAVLNRRLLGAVQRGPKAYAPVAWLKTSTPLSLVAGFSVMVGYSDVIVLSQFRPPDEVAIYYAATKTLSFVTFIYFAVAQTVAHKFAEYHLAGDRKRLEDYVAHSIRMTFWPSLGLILLILALGVPLLRMFGAGFASGYSLMFIIAIGLLARAAVGPAERLLNMLTERRACALIYAGSFSINLALCFALIPHLKLTGAAIASVCSLVFESTCLFLVAKHRLGIHCLIFGRPKAS
jgi:O-antigen/teichoic acid export membrane protein